MKRSLTIPFVAFLVMLGCRDPYTQIRIASSATISQDWIEIRPAEPLHWTQPVQEFSFHIDSPHAVSRELQIVAPDGKRGVPDVELVASDGRTLVLDSHGFWGEDMYFYSRETPAPVTVQAIRIRSNFPLHISGLTWRGYDPAKVKR